MVPPWIVHCGGRVPGHGPAGRRAGAASPAGQAWTGPDRSGQVWTGLGRAWRRRRSPLKRRRGRQAQGLGRGAWGMDGKSLKRRRRGRDAAARERPPQGSAGRRKGTCSVWLCPGSGLAAIWPWSGLGLAQAWLRSGCGPAMACAGRQERPPGGGVPPAALERACRAGGQGGGSLRRNKACFLKKSMTGPAGMAIVGRRTSSLPAQALAARAAGRLRPQIQELFLLEEEGR